MVRRCTATRCARLWPSWPGISTRSPSPRGAATHHPAASPRAISFQTFIHPAPTGRNIAGRPTFVPRGVGDLNMPGRKHSRTVIITGASAGVGRAIATRFARAGDRVGLIARDRSALQDMQRELQACAAHAEFEAVDVADADALFAAAERLEQRLGPVDIWINDAMETVFSMVADITPDE